MMTHPLGLAAVDKIQHIAKQGRKMELGYSGKRRSHQPHAGGPSRRWSRVTGARARQGNYNPV